MRRRHGLIHIAKALGWLLLWSVAWTPVIKLPPVWGAVWLVTWCGLFLWRNVWKSRRDKRYSALFRLRSFTPYTHWLIAVVPFEVAISVSLILLYVHLALFDLVPPLPMLPPIFTDEYLRHPLGKVVDWLLFVCVAPLVEEFAFRGKMQRPLEREWGPLAAIAVTAFVFALAHALLAAAPGHMVFGLIAGYSVYVTRSIWAGVLTHFLSNVIVMGVLPHTPLDAQLSSPPPIALLFVAILLSSVVLVVVLRRLRGIARAERLARIAGVPRRAGCRELLSQPPVRSPVL